MVLVTGENPKMTFLFYMYSYYLTELMIGFMIGYQQRNQLKGTHFLLFSLNANKSLRLLLSSPGYQHGRGERYSLRICLLKLCLWFVATTQGKALCFASD